MIYIEQGLYVTIQQLSDTALPLPLVNGFSLGNAYLVLGAFSLSESGEAYFILSNDRDEIWFISNRHLRTYKLLPELREFRISVESEKVSHAPH